MVTSLHLMSVSALQHTHTALLPLSPVVGLRVSKSMGFTYSTPAGVQKILNPLVAIVDIVRIPLDQKFANFNQKLMAPPAVHVAGSSMHAP